MGSSFVAAWASAAVPPAAPGRRGRSSANDAHLVARRLALELDDVTFSGATTQDMLAATAAGRPAQIDAATPAHEAGDPHGRRQRRRLGSPHPAVQPARPVRAILPVRRQLDSYADPDLTEQRFRTLRESLLKIAAEVRRRAPESRLVFVDYLTVLPPDETTPTGVLPADVAEWGRAVARRLSGITRDVAAQSGSVFVAASSASANHHAWSATPWTRRFHLSLRGGAPYHPNAAGMAAVAELVAAALAPPRAFSRQLPGAQPQRWLKTHATCGRGARFRPWVPQFRPWVSAVPAPGSAVPALASRVPAWLPGFRPWVPRFRPCPPCLPDRFSRRSGPGPGSSPYSSPLALVPPPRAAFRSNPAGPMDKR